jgi:hypothetical protein
VGTHTDRERLEYFRALAQCATGGTPQWRASRSEIVTLFGLVARAHCTGDAAVRKRARAYVETLEVRGYQTRRMGLARRLLDVPFGKVNWREFPTLDYMLAACPNLSGFPPGS